MGFFPFPCALHLFVEVGLPAKPAHYLLPACCRLCLWLGFSFSTTPLCGGWPACKACTIPSACLLQAADRLAGAYLAVYPKQRPGVHAAFASLLNSAAREPQLLASVAPRLAGILLHHSLRTTEHLMACTMPTFLQRAFLWGAAEPCPAAYSRFGSATELPSRERISMYADLSVI